MRAVRLSSFAPTGALSDALSGGSELEHKHPLLKLGNRPEYLAYQPAGRIVVAARQVHAIGREQANPDLRELAQDHLLDHEVTRQAVCAFDEDDADPVRLKMV